MRVHKLSLRAIPWLIVATVLLSCVAPIPKAKAAEGFNLTVSPLPTSLTTKPGQTVNTPIRFQNSGTEPAKINVSLMKFRANGTTGSPELIEPTKADEFIKWASFSQTSFDTKPGVFNTVTMTIKPPKTAAFGYYYAVVFSRDRQVPMQQNENRVRGAVASLVLLDVQAAGEKRQVEVSSFKATRKLYQYLPANFEVKATNTGNIHVVPTGNIFIHRAGSDEFIGTLKVNDAQGNVLPKSSRTFTSEWGDGFPSYQVKRQNGQVVSDKNSQPVKELSWDLKNANKLRLGKYVASLTLVYNDGQRDVPVEGEVSFWVIPWVPFLLILLVVVLIGFGIFFIIRSVVRKIRPTRIKRA